MGAALQGGWCCSWMTPTSCAAAASFASVAPMAKGTRRSIRLSAACTLRTDRCLQLSHLLVCDDLDDRLAGCWHAISSAAVTRSGESVPGWSDPGLMCVGDMCW